MMKRIPYFVLTLVAGILLGGVLSAHPVHAGGFEEEEFGQKLSFHGYGELHYNNPGGDSAAKMDFHRFVIGLSYPFNDRVSLHAEVDFEHAATELELEFAYLDFQYSPTLNYRIGSMLMPVGPLNEFHEPPLFYSVERPYVQKYIIPTTWMEGGIGAFGSIGEDMRYRLYLVSGLDAAEFSAKSGIRGGRGKVASQSSEDLAVVGRLEYFGMPGLDLGASLYTGGANTTKDSALGNAGVTIWEGDVRVRRGGWDLRGVFARVDVSDADQISAVTGETIGEVMQGWTLEAAYDLLGRLAPHSDRSLVVFVRLEDFNTQKEVPLGLLADPDNDRQVTTVGLAYYPHPNVAIKADYENWKDNDNQMNLGMAFQY